VVRADIDVNVLCGGVTPPVDHPLAEVLRRAAHGEFPPSDGLAELMPPDSNGTRAVVSFTGHAYVLSELQQTDFAGIPFDGYGGASSPTTLLRIADGAEIGMVDVVLVRSGAGGTSPLAERDDLEHHPRVQRARHHRSDVQVLGDERGFVTIGMGLVGRTELSVELLDGEQSRGAGRSLIGAGLHAIAEDQLVFAQVSPGNAASLRAFLACGFVPIGSEVLIEVRSAGS
jgi:hypothetical protein